MADKSCQACADLMNDAPGLIVNGMTEAECLSLQNNTGLNPASGNDDCTDLDNMNDCLIGNMVDEIDAYDVCEWKDFTKNFVDNTWTVLKGIICAICGIWTHIKKMQCQIAYLYNGQSFSLGETYRDTTKTHIVAGKGVSFLKATSTGTSNDIGASYIGGAFAVMSGSCIFHTADFTDVDSCYNFDSNGVNPSLSSARSGNPIWNNENFKTSELVYEIRVKMSEYPQIRSFHSGVALNTYGGGFHAQIYPTSAGYYAPGQHGDCDHNTGEPRGSSDRGHLVPNGWTYIQMRITWIEDMNGSASGAQYTPSGIFGIKMNADKAPC